MKWTWLTLTTMPRQASLSLKRPHQSTGTAGVDAAAHALLLGEKLLIDAVTTPLVPAALFATVARVRDVPAAHAAINYLRLILSVLPVGPDETEAAFNVQSRYM